MLDCYSRHIAFRMSDREIVRAVLVQHKVLADGTTAPDLTSAVRPRARRGTLCGG